MKANLPEWKGDIMSETESESLLTIRQDWNTGKFWTQTFMMLHIETKDILRNSIMYY